MDYRAIKIQEIQHGREIADRAETIWGWDSPTGIKRAERRVNFLINFAHIKVGQKILEIGCGTGVYTKKLAETGAQICAIDISSDLLMKAKQKVKSDNVRFYEADVEQLPFADSEFDAVIGVSVLHHLNLNGAIEEIKRVLKSDGIIVFSEPNMMNPHIAIQKNIPFIKKLAGDTPTETAFFRWPLKRLLEDTGFVDVNIKPFDFLYPKTPKNMINLIERLGLVIEKIPLLKEFAGSLIITARYEALPVLEHFNRIADNYNYWKKKNWYYYQELKNILKNYIKSGKRILDFGCGTGEIINYLEPSYGIGFDTSDAMIKIAKKKFGNNKNISFIGGVIESLSVDGNLDFIISVDVIEHLENPHETFKKIKNLSSQTTRVIITMANPFWEPALMVAEKLGLKMPEGPHKRLPIAQVEQLLNESGFRINEIGYRTLLPINIPFISDSINKYFYKIPLIKKLAFIIYFICQPL